MDSSWNEDLEAYYNQISRKAHNFQHEIPQSSISISTPTHMSDEIKEINGVESAPPLLKNQDEKMSKVKLLEKKYSKMPVKNEGKRQLSVSWSLEEFNSAGVLESESAPWDKADLSPEPYNDYSYNLNLKASNETSINLKNVPTLNEIYAPSSEGKTEEERKDLVNSNYHQSLLADEKSPFFASGTAAAHTRRKSSTGSLLMNKAGIFYSSSISTDPKVKTKSSNKPASKDGKFNKNNATHRKSSSVSTQATESIEEEVLTREEPSNADRKEAPNLHSNDPKKAQSNRERMKRERPLLAEKVTTSTQGHSPEGGRCAAGSQSKKKDQEAKLEKKFSRGTKEITMTGKRGVKLDEESHRECTDSSSVTSSLDSLSSFSFTVKVKKNKYKKRKRRLKKEKELTELIVKTLIKNLPFLMRDPFLHHHPVHRTEYSEPCTTCNQGDWTSWRLTNSRVDDALRQSIQLTRQFIDVHEKFLLTHTRSLAPFRYTSLKRP